MSYIEPFRDGERGSLEGFTSSVVTVCPTPLTEYDRLYNQFGLVACLARDILRRAPAPEDDLDQNIDEIEFATEIAKLKELCGQIEHTSAYYEFLDNARDIAIKKLEASLWFSNALARWTQLTARGRKRLLEHEQAEYGAAAREVSGLLFKNTPFRFYKTPKRVSPHTGKTHITCGYFTTGDDKKDRRGIYMNTHADAGYENGYSALGIGAHEVTHDHQDQLGDMWQRGVDLGPLEHDGMICYLEGYRNATVSSRIYSGYRAQFHEKSAFYQGDAFENALRDMLFRRSQPREIDAQGLAL